MTFPASGPGLLDGLCTDCPAKAFIACVLQKECGRRVWERMSETEKARAARAEKEKTWIGQKVYSA